MFQSYYEGGHLYEFYLLSEHMECVNGFLQQTSIP
jgi:hypothetical protein